MADILDAFSADAEQIRSLEIAHRVNTLGGYGAAGEVIYHAQPPACPSVLVDQRGIATATFMSNGSVSLSVSPPDDMQISVLDGHFDAVEKREIGAPSSGVWLSLGDDQAVSLMNPRQQRGCQASGIKIVKLGDPQRAMWYCTALARPSLSSAIRLRLVDSPAGPALLREISLRNDGRTAITAQLWTSFTLHGTQRFVYNKEIWYDSGMPIDDADLVVSATVPYSDRLQIKRVASRWRNLTPEHATCDYLDFVGDSADYAALPRAVLRGALTGNGAGRRLSRFASTAVAASSYALTLEPEQEAVLVQSLGYIADERIVQGFRKRSGSRAPSYLAVESAFDTAARWLVERTPDPERLCQQRARTSGAGAADFALDLPTQPVVAEYANSVWTTVQELYENCRAHGAKLADGIELGTRDRGQDMWPKMKEDPGRVRADLVHALGFMYQTCEKTPRTGRKALTLREKLHGMFPRQYPSRWEQRATEIFNDNRPYTDSPVWLIDSLCRYIRETGDDSILFETVGTVALTRPDDPEHSGMIGHQRRLRIAEVVDEVFGNYARSAADSPYGLIQILYGDWCDPVDMFGTSTIGDASTRGHGRGAQVRLSAHVALSAITAVDVLGSTRIAAALRKRRTKVDIDAWRALARSLRERIMAVAWEDAGRDRADAGFINVIHELDKQGKRPKNKGLGYTLGSNRKRDFDGVARRELTTQSFCLGLLLAERDWLPALPDAESKIAAVLLCVDHSFFNPKLGLVLYTTPLANNQRTIDMVGRMGVLPSGCAENGEYHHAQVFMHYFRLSRGDQADQVWQEFLPMLSASRDEGLGGPFETPSTSYVMDPDDPHHGMGMYFGLSGSIDWIVEIFQRIAGVELDLHDPDQPDVSVDPRLPEALDHQLGFRRIVHVADGKGGYRRVPLSVRCSRSGGGSALHEIRYTINGKRVERPVVEQIGGMKKIDVGIEYVF